MKKRTLLVIAIIAGCNGEEPPASKTHDDLPALAYLTPEDWVVRRSHDRDSTTTTWTPAKDNIAKESIVVVQSRVYLRAADKNLAFVEKTLLQAQKTLPAAVVTPPTPLKLPHGLQGVQIEIDYQPPKQAARYHRVHAVLLDGESLLHVMYTAATPDVNHVALDTILNSLRHERV